MEENGVVLSEGEGSELGPLGEGSENGVELRGDGVFASGSSDGVGDGSNAGKGDGVGDEIKGEEEGSVDGIGDGGIKEGERV